MGVCWKLEAPEAVKTINRLPLSEVAIQKESIHEHQISAIYA